MQSGSWDDISGETFLRGLLSRGIEIAKYSVVSLRHQQSDPAFAAVGSTHLCFNLVSAVCGAKHTAEQRL